MAAPRTKPGCQRARRALPRDVIPVFQFQCSPAMGRAPHPLVEAGARHAEETLPDPSSGRSHPAEQDAPPARAGTSHPVPLQQQFHSATCLHAHLQHGKHLSTHNSKY